jgi:hypothetical protein
MEVRIRNLRWLPPLSIGEHGKNTRKTNLNYICMVIRWLFTRRLSYLNIVNDTLIFSVRS